MTMLPMNPAILKKQLEANGWVGRRMQVTHDTGGQVTVRTAEDGWTFWVGGSANAHHWTATPSPDSVPLPDGWDPLTLPTPEWTPERAQPLPTPGTCPEPNHKETPK